MTAELIELLRPHVRFNVTGPIRSDWRETAPAHVDVIGAMATNNGTYDVAEALLDAIRDTEVGAGFDAVVGIDFGGALVAAALACFSDGDFPARYVRWVAHLELGMTPEVIGDVAGKRVVVVGDVATTGRALMGAISALREAGAIVEEAIVVVDREEGADALLAGAGVRLRALVTLKELR